MGEESLWGLCAALLVTRLLLMWRRVDASRRPLLAIWCAAGMAYVAYMFAADVPMYWSRWLADEIAGRGYFTVAQGLADVSARWVRVARLGALAVGGGVDDGLFQRGRVAELDAGAGAKAQGRPNHHTEAERRAGFRWSAQARKHQARRSGRFGRRSAGRPARPMPPRLPCFQS